MKKLGVILLCLCILLTGCGNGNSMVNGNNNKSLDSERKASSNQADVTNPSEKTSDTMVNKLLTLNTEWSLVDSLAAADKEYKATEYEAKVPGYTIKSDLTNIENIGQFSGFTKKQKNMLVKNGFVVIPSTDTRIYYTYDSNEYKGIPNFITSDCALHLYHQFYDKSLMSVENDYLYKDLGLMTKQMLSKSILLMKELEDKDLKALQEQNIIYFLVARMLYTQKEDETTGVDQKLIEAAKKEYNLCQAAKGYQESPLIGKSLDYSQFSVRGHYTRSEELGRYFKTMMWLGLAPYELEENGSVNYDNVYRALLISFTTFSESGKDCDAKLWSDIYQPTSQYVGESDDVNVFDMNGLRISVYGSSEDPNIFNDASYQSKLAEAVKALPEPQIQATLESIPTAAGKQFRFMGQRYTLDADILQKLIDNNKRPLPSSLDVMGVLGSQTAEQLLSNTYKPQDSWPAYTDNYKSLKVKVAAKDTDYWKTNLYSGWLWSLQEVTKEYSANSGMPFFMTTDAWKYKNLNTALGSYAELKHDTVLYAKQATAEEGGPNVFANQHYVEPEVNLYSKLLYLTDQTVAVLKDKGMLNKNIKTGSQDYKSFLKLLRNCSVKELKNQKLSSKEKKQLLWCGGTMESILMSFQRGAGAQDGIQIDLSDMLAADISTCLNTYQTVGTGYFDSIYVVVPVEGKLYLTRGSVYSSYEFASNTRLTDEAWWALNGIKKVSTDYGDYIEIGKPSASMPKQMEWIKKFKTGANHVKLKELEVNWDNLDE